MKLLPEIKFTFKEPTLLKQNNKEEKEMPIMTQ